MIKTLSLITSLSLPSISQAITLGEAIDSIQEMSEVSGSFDDGGMTVKKRRCRLDGSYSNGKYSDYRSTAIGLPTVKYDEEKDDFKIYYSYKCRVRTRIKAGCTGVQSNTDDTDYFGKIKLTVTFSPFQQLVKVQKDETDLGGNGLCGKMISEKITNSLHDRDIL